MKIIVSILVAVVIALVVGCATPPATTSAPALNPTATPTSESGLSTGSTSSDIQEQLNELQQQVQRLNQRVDAIGEQVSDQGKRLDGLNAEIVAIKQQSAEQVDKKEMTNSPSVPEAPPGTIFTFSGQSYSQSLPFTIQSSPWKLKLWMDAGIGQVGLWIHICDPAKPQDYNIVGRYFMPMMETGTTIRETISYVPSGTYYIEVKVDSWVTYTVWVVEP